MKVNVISIDSKNYEIADHDIYASLIPPDAEEVSKHELPQDIIELLELNDIFDEIPETVYVKKSNNNMLIYYVVS